MLSVPRSQQLGGAGQTGRGDRAGAGRGLRAKSGKLQERKCQYDYCLGN